MEINFQYLFNVVPDPVLIIDKTGKVIYRNVAAKDILKLNDNSDKIESLFLDKRKIKDSIHNLLSYHRVVELSALIYESNNEIKPYSLKITILSDENLLFLCTFYSIESKNELLKHLIDNSFNAELNELRPYLNKSGKEFLIQKLDSAQFSDAFFSKESSVIDTDFFSDDYCKLLSAWNSDLSQAEIQLCILIAQGAKVQQVAMLLSKNENAIRVMLHRIVRKTATEDLTSLQSKLNEILNNK